MLHIVMCMVSFPRLAGSALANTRIKHKMGFQSVVRISVQIRVLLHFHRGVRHAQLPQFENNALVSYSKNNHRIPYKDNLTVEGKSKLT